MAKLKQVDIDRGVRDKLADEYLQSVEKRVQKVRDEYYTKPDTIFDVCPYCSPNEPVEYQNTRTFREIGNRKYIVLTCPKCNKTVFCNIKVRESGDVFSGYSYETEVSMSKQEDIEKPEEKHKLQIRFLNT